MHRVDSNAAELTVVVRGVPSEKVELWVLDVVGLGDPEAVECVIGRTGTATMVASAANGCDCR